MLTTPVDNLNLKNDSEIKAILNREEIYYSDKIIKVRQGIFSSNQERVIIITDQAVYNFKGKEKKRRIDIGSLSGVTISKISEQFIIHGKDDEYDYLYSSPNRVKIIEILEIVYESITQNELLFSILNEKDLSKFVVNKAERKKEPGLYKVDSSLLMSIREFIESGGSMKINTHAGSLLLEKEFKNAHKNRNESLSNFKIKSIIGKGKSSIIYLAEYKGEYVALKVFDKLYLYKNDLIERVVLEKNILCSFNDNNFLCHMKFYFTTKTKVIFVLPFYPGGDLFNLILKVGKFDESTIAFYATQIANMISFLHSKNIAYRDLKLENLMINENGYLTLIDFGSCKIVEDANELESSFVGSPDYMSPEMINGEGHNLMTDWWSYGILLYELLNGVPPFHDEAIERCFDLITSSNVRFPIQVKFTPNIKDFILKLLRKNPNERLGRGEYDEIIQHPFFQSVNPKNIIMQKTTSPKKPTISESEPLLNFDNIYLHLKIEILDKAVDLSLLNQISGLFEEFEN
jgi:serum/glucocorticoid-regulated kinase 2